MTKKIIRLQILVLLFSTLQTICSTKGGQLSPWQNHKERAVLPSIVRQALLRQRVKENSWMKQKGGSNEIVHASDFMRVARNKGCGNESAPGDRNLLVCPGAPKRTVKKSFKRKRGRPTGKSWMLQQGFPKI